LLLFRQKHCLLKLLLLVTDLLHGLCLQVQHLQVLLLLLWQLRLHKLGCRLLLRLLLWHLLYRLSPWLCKLISSSGQIRPPKCSQVDRQGGQVLEI
jgi:hypothetical protein